MAQEQRKQWGILISQEQLDATLHKAAESGAIEALRRIGLSDENASSDLREIRDVLSAWRSAKRTAFETFVKWVTVGLLSIISASAFLHYYGGGK